MTTTTPEKPSRTEIHRATAYENMLNDWPAVPSLQHFSTALQMNDLINQHIEPSGHDTVEFIDPYGRTAHLRSVYSKRPNISIRKKKDRDKVHALWTAQDSLEYHNAAVDLFQELDLNNAHHIPGAHPALIALPEDERRAMAIKVFNHTMAETGESWRSIGMAWTYTEPEDPEHTYHQFALLPANTRWMGVCASLPLSKGIAFIVCPSRQDQAIPGHAIGFPAYDNWQEGFTNLTDGPKSSQASTLHKVLSYHGAQCRWKT